MKKKSALSTRARVARTTASASGLALIMGLVNVAVGANTTITVATPITEAADLSIATTDSHAINTSQFRGQSTTGTVVGSGFSDESSGSSTIVAPGNTLSAVATSNTVTSTATSDTFDASADFSINSAQATVLNGSQSIATGISGSPLVNIVFSAPVTEATLNNNIVSAATSVNQANASITQTNLQGFITAVAGSAKADRMATTTPKIDVTANGMMTNYQQATYAGGMTGSSAAITGATLNVDATSADAGNLAVGSTITLAGNQALATYSANDASSQYTGTGTAFDGSLAIANFQNSTDDAAASGQSTSSIAGSGVMVSTGAINGDVTVSAQKFDATSDGNSAVNSLTLDVATGISGTAAGSPTAVAAADATTLSAATTAATAGIASVQGNVGANLESSIATSNITVAGTGRAGAITLSDNSSLALASGNTAANTLSLKAGNLDEASGTIANAQANDTGTAVKATNNTDINVAGAGGTPIEHTGPVALSGNSIGSSAVGSKATNVTLVQADTSIDSTADTAAFQTHNSQFSSPNSSVTATTDGDIGANLVGATSVNGLLADNTIDSSAKVNVATNGIGITGGSGDYMARVVNEQVSYSAATATTTGNMLAAGEVDITIPGSALALSGNTLSASASGNQATNTSSNNVAGALIMGLTAPPGSSLVSNDQLSNSGSVTAIAGDAATALGIAATGTSGGAGDVLGNTLKSQAVANSAANTAASTAGTSLNAVAATDSTLYNYQHLTLTNVASTTTGKVGIDISAILQNKANVIGNTLQATGTANEVENTLALAAGTTTSGRGSIESTQNAYGTTTVAVETPGVGINMTSAGSTGVATVSGNTLRASAMNNQAFNNYSNTAGTALATGGGSSLLDSIQKSSGKIESTVGGTTPLSNAQLGIVASGSVGGAADVLGNILQSVAVGSSVQNTAALTAGTSLELAAASNSTLSNDQYTVPALISTTRGSVTIDAGDAISGKTSVNNNTLQAIGTKNEAFNTLTLTAGTSVSGAASLDNEQLTTDVTAASVESAGVGITSAGGSISGQATVNGNAVQSQAIANLANNTLTIVSGTGSTARAETSNKQTNHRDVTSTTTLTGLVGVGAGTSLEGTATVGSNLVSALAFGNTASNALNATGGAGALNGTLSSASTQFNTSAVSAGVTGPAVGPMIGVTAAAASVAGYTVNLLGNRVSSTAYGNSVENVLNALSTGTMSASAQLASSQTNFGTISARVTNAGMGVSGVGAPAIAGRSVMSGNTISATAVGNSSVSQMVIGR
ncbi:beta strand repeat-containing protein [Allopusillimonas ginsengisoli]|uniref:beta strand repeat-containing protein n=1 Tax=Allopusillimonas ginsengisoli TaxID=453575 RepID=UPI0039C4CEF0